MRGSWTGDEVRLESLVSLSPRLASVGGTPCSGSLISPPPPPPPSLSGMRCALLSLEGGRVVRALIRSSCYSRSPTDDRWSGPKDRGLLVWGRAGAHSGSASVVSAFSSPLLAPGFAWRPSFRGRRCYTHLPPGGLALGVIPTGVRLFFFYFLNPRGVLSFLSVWRYPYWG